MEEPIPKDIAVKLCNEIREENSRKRFSYHKTFCRFCKGGCISANEKNRGCGQVNRRYDKSHMD